MLRVTDPVDASFATVDPVLEAPVVAIGHTLAAIAIFDRPLGMHALRLTALVGALIALGALLERPLILGTLVALGALLANPLVLSAIGPLATRLLSLSPALIASDSLGPLAARLLGLGPALIASDPLGLLATGLLGLGPALIASDSVGALATRLLGPLPALGASASTAFGFLGLSVSLLAAPAIAGLRKSRSSNCHRRDAGGQNQAFHRSNSAVCVSTKSKGGAFPRNWGLGGNRRRLGALG